MVAQLPDKRMNDGWLRRHEDAIRLPRLTRIHFQNHEVTDAGLRVLRDHPSLETLNLTEEQYSADCLTELGCIPRLSELSIPRVALSESSVRQLANCPKLIALSCHGGSPGLTELGSLKGLRILSLRHASDDSLRRLSASCPVQSFYLYEFSITDASIPDLLKLPQLQKIVFGRNNSSLSPEGLEKLKAAGITVDDLRDLSIL